MSLELGPIAEPGYESDTGERDNPSCLHFKNRQPVEKTIEVGFRKKVLNRQGRAICRIVRSHNWSLVDIARIFGVSETSVARAVDNVRKSCVLPRDRVSEDYARVDPEFAIHFPPIPVTQSPYKMEDGVLDEVCTMSTHTSHTYMRKLIEDQNVLEHNSNGRPSRAAKLGFYTRLQKIENSDESPIPANPPLKRSRDDETMESSPTDIIPTEQDSAMSSTTKKPRYGNDGSDTQYSTVSSHIQHTVKKEESERCGKSGFQASSQSSSSRGSTTVVTLKLREPTGASGVSPQRQPHSQSAPVQTPLPLPQRSLPPPPNTQGSAATLSAFLENVKAIDLSGHRALLEAQGFSVARLHIIAAWQRDDIEEALRRLLMGSEAVATGRKGLTALELISLEIAIRKLKGSNTPQARSSHPPPSVTQLASYLKQVMGFDLSAHHDLLNAQGFSVTRLRGVATLDRAEVREILTRTLTVDVPGTGGKMKPLEVLALEFALRDAGAKDSSSDLDMLLDLF
ncbi:hypothetical protein B0H11DRAFT_2093071 [Mycena galericulata]|nr:hypothetical protein B0H11DRAFT_2093071 [Mycena galericulata]